jgi:hypothetical protein
MSSNQSTAPEPTLDELYEQVTAAILRAEAAEAERDEPRAADAQFDVSCLEEEIASRIPADDPEGEIARRGVLRAGLRAHQHARVVELGERYLAEPLASEALKQTLKEFLDEALRAVDEAFKLDVKVIPVARFRLHEAA